MASVKKIISSKINIKKAQTKWQNMSHRQRAIAMPNGVRKAKEETKDESWTTSY